MDVLPWTNDDLSRSLSPGAAVCVSMRRHEDPASCQTQDLMVMGIDERDLLLAWPEETGPPPPLGAPLKVSMLRFESHGPRRYGFDTSVIDTSDPNESGAVDSGLVVVLPRPEHVLPLNLRTHRRFKVNGSDSVRIDLPEWEPTALQDISWEGLRFEQGPPIRPLAISDTLGISLIINETRFIAGCQVVRVEQTGDKQQVSAKLPTMALNLRAALADLFLRLEPLQEFPEHGDEHC